MTAALYADPLILWERLLKRVTISETGCWTWTGCVTSRGYGCIASGKSGRTVLTHQLSVIVRDGSIPDGMTVDHECHDSATCRLGVKCPHRRCVNPAHLTVKTSGENSARQWEAGRCRQGHELAWRTRGDGKARFCPECVSEKRSKENGKTSSDYWKARRAAKVSAA